MLQQSFDPSEHDASFPRGAHERQNILQFIESNYVRHIIQHEPTWASDLGNNVRDDFVADLKHSINIEHESLMHRLHNSGLLPRRVGEDMARAAQWLSLYAQHLEALFMQASMFRMGLKEHARRRRTDDADIENGSKRRAITGHPMTFARAYFGPPRYLQPEFGSGL